MPARSGERTIRIGLILAGDARTRIELRPLGIAAEVRLDDRPAGRLDDRDALVAGLDEGAVRVVGEQLAGRAGRVRIEPVTRPPLRPREGIELRGVPAGRGFHWQKDIDATFPGAIEILPAAGGLVVLNEVGVEDYLAGVITAEMGPECPAALLEAQAIVARSWLLAMRESKHADEPFDRCNDDCCQRYQGTTHLSAAAIRAIDATRGRVLLAPDGRVLDANYAKSCGGITEHPRAVWGLDKPGLVPVVDAPPDAPEHERFAWVAAHGGQPPSAGDAKHEDQPSRTGDAKHGGQPPSAGDAKHGGRPPPAGREPGPRSGASGLRARREPESRTTRRTETSDATGERGGLARGEPDSRGRLSPIPNAMPEAFIEAYLAGSWLAQTRIWCSPRCVPPEAIDRYLGRVDEPDTYFRWKTSVARETVERLLRQHVADCRDLAELRSVRVTRRGVSGRAIEALVEWIDPRGRARHTVLASEYRIRQVLHPRFLYSSAVRIEPRRDAGGRLVSLHLRGAGWGHGVGMCQIGALGMALAGRTAEQICRHYYPLTTLRTLP